MIVRMGPPDIAMKDGDGAALYQLSIDRVRFFAHVGWMLWQRLIEQKGAI